MVLFRDLIGFSTMSPLWNNICVALLTVGYVKLIIETAGLIRKRTGIAEESRKFFHICGSNGIMFWPLFDTTHWSWRLNVLVPAVMAVRFFYKGAIVKDPNDEDVQTLSRSSSPSELLFGPLQFTCLMVWAGLYQFLTEEAAIILAAVGIGDGIAPLIGARYGRHVYRMPFGNTKTMEGTVCGVFLGTIAGCYLYPYMLGIVPILPLRIILAYGAIAALVEASSPGNMDNILVPVVLHFTIERVKEWLFSFESI